MGGGRMGAVFPGKPRSPPAVPKRILRALRFEGVVAAIGGRGRNGLRGRGCGRRGAAAVWQRGWAAAAAPALGRGSPGSAGERPNASASLAGEGAADSACGRSAPALGQPRGGEERRVGKQRGRGACGFSGCLNPQEFRTASRLKIHVSLSPVVTRCKMSFEFCRLWYRDVLQFTISGN